MFFLIISFHFNFLFLYFFFFFKIKNYLLRNSAKDRVISADSRTDFVVLLLGVASSVELWCRGEHRATEPHGVPLHVVRDDAHIDLGGLDAALGELDGGRAAGVDKALDITLETTAKVLVEGGTARKDDVLVEATAGIDGAGLDGLVDEDGEGGEEVARVDLGVEEDLGGEETLVADVDRVGLLGDGVEGLVDAEPLCGVGVVLGKLLGDVGAHVRVLLLDALGHLLGLGGGDALVALTEELLDKEGDVAAGDGDVLDARADDVALGDGDDVSHTITRVDNGTGEGTLGHLAAGPGGSEGENGLNGDVETGDVEGLEEDLGEVLTVLGGVERRLGEEEVVVLGLGAEVLEDGLLPVLLHVGPVVDLAVTDGVGDLVGLGGRDSLLADVEVEVLNTLLGHALGNLVGRDHGGDDEAGLVVAGITDLGVPGTVINNYCRKSGLGHCRCLFTLYLYIVFYIFTFQLGYYYIYLFYIFFYIKLSFLLFVVFLYMVVKFNLYLPYILYFFAHIGWKKFFFFHSCIKHIFFFIYRMFFFFSIL